MGRNLAGAVGFGQKFSMHNQWHCPAYNQRVVEFTAKGMRVETERDSIGHAIGVSD